MFDLVSCNCTSCDFGSSPGPSDLVGVALVMKSMGFKLDFFIYTVSEKLCSKETCSESNERPGQLYLNKNVPSKTLPEKEYI